jgi:hypothetical protein
MVQGNTFMVTQLNGQIAAEGELGVFAKDTRFVSYYAIFADGKSWVWLNSATTAYYSSRVYLTNPAIEKEGGTIAPGTLALTLNRIVSTGIHEDIDIVNYGLNPVKFNLEIALRSDFADIYEVKAHHFVRRGNIVTTANEAENVYSTAYKNGDFQRSFSYQICNLSSPPYSANGRISFLVELAPGESWHTCGYYILNIDGMEERAPITPCDRLPTELSVLQQDWNEQATHISTAQEEIYRLYQRSLEDMSALRLHDRNLGITGISGYGAAVSGLDRSIWRSRW